MQNKKATEVKRLLDNDIFLLDAAYNMIQQGQQSIGNLVLSLEVIDVIQACISTKSAITWSKLYVKGLSGELFDSPLVREILLLVRKLPSDRMLDMLKKLSFNPILDFGSVRSDLEVLMAVAANSGASLHSEYDVHHETLRTTVVAQKVSLSRHRSVLSKDDTAYSRLVDRVNEGLQDFFKEHLIRPKDLPLHEIFLFDLKSPCRYAFMPLPRHAVERALSAPHDYLNCDCCKGQEGGLSASQPPTAILFQLYLESGALINISDLWSAFYAILGSGEQEGEDGVEEEQIL